MRVQLNQISIALALFGFASAVRGPLEYVGCFDSPTNVEFSRTYIYQSVGFCADWCESNNQPVIALTNGTNCLCSQAVPSFEAVSDSFCNRACSGYAQEMCGGRGYFSIYYSAQPDEPNQETLTQSIEPAETGVALPAVSIENQPAPLAGSYNL
ncbi:hypothetical protein F4813DRAFT_387401 [Daldinia decipiens]|uniref:uncharacterized protein n=1 Tax=Daldinia decipiens TaxID=326647 RepID=UPI0020C2E3E9|nr:uncharacterized protein F4813DRAFT_387401 [Daldinia decipiens]KAI1659911.1 hypothetical protein F4813DRAFT_387401 [Daldinia decipiens]